MNWRIPGAVAPLLGGLGLLAGACDTGEPWDGGSQAAVVSASYRPPCVPLPSAISRRDGGRDDADAAGGLRAARDAIAPLPKIQLLEPRPGEQVARESVHRIVWSVSGPPPGSRVVIEHSTDGVSFTAVGTARAEDGAFLYTVPPEGPVKRTLRVSATWCGGGFVDVGLELTPSQRRSYKWVQIASNTAVPQRDGAGSLVYNDRMWIIGGWYPSEPKYYPLETVNDVWSSTDGANWTLEKPNTFGLPGFDPAKDWEGRHTAGYVVHDGKMWILGGDPLQRHYQPDAWSSTDGKKWNLETPALPWGSRALHYTVPFRGGVWVMGGQTMTDYVSLSVNNTPYTLYDDVWASEDGRGWKRIVPEGPRWAPRGAIVGSAVKDGRMWILGGGTYESLDVGVVDRVYYGDVWSSEDGASWRRDARTTPWSAREYHSVCVWDDRLWVIAGYNEANLDGAWYSQNGHDWYPTTTAWGARHAASVWVYRDAIWLHGGTNVDVWRLDRL